jgi:8-amino-7-oxononanoate synthase
MFLEKKLQERERFGNKRTLRSTHPLIDFASNDYLGLSRSKEFYLAVTKEWEMLKYPNPLGATGSRLLTGNSPYVEELEQSIAVFHGFETGLLFGCGYMANIGLLSSVATSGDAIFYDAQIHASTLDGIKLSRAQAFPFRHNDPDHLEKRLKMFLQGKRFVCVESVYSMNGAIVRLEEISDLCTKYGAHLIVDEAHAVGVFGENGQGFAAEKKRCAQIFAQISTFGKALGAYGAIILGSSCLREYLINFARSFIYTTALPLQALAVIKCAYAMLPVLEKERSHLFSLINHYRMLQPAQSRTAIQPFPIKGNKEVKELSCRLEERGFDVRPIMSPTVRRGSECLRICLHAFNTNEEITRLLEVING